MRFSHQGVNGAYLIRKNQEESTAYDAAKNKRWWIYLSANDAATGSDVRVRLDSPTCKGDCGVMTNPELQSQTGKLDNRLSSTPTFSHVGIVLDADLDTATMYYDGVKVKEKKFPAGHIGGADCGYAGPNVFFALNHKPEVGDPTTTVNSGGMSGRVADWRMYVGTKLTEQDMLKLATTSADSTGVLHQRCQSRTGNSQPDDASFRDTAGHDCSWYQEAMQLELESGGGKGPGSVCASASAKRACPTACGLSVRCYGDPDVTNWAR